MTECVEEGQPRGSKGVPRPYQHWRWKAAGQWSQHRRSPPSLQLSQLSWLVALPLLRGSFSGFRLRFSASSDLGGASRAWICCTHIQTACVHTRSSRAVRRPPGAASPSPTHLPPFVLLPPIQDAPRTSQPPEPGGAHPNRVPAAQQREKSFFQMGRIRVGGWGEGARFPSRHFLVWTVGDSKAQLRRGPKPGTRTCWGKHKGADKKGVGRPAGATRWSGLELGRAKSRAAGR